MADISIPTLRANILDRMDNEVVTQRLSEQLRQKLRATKRVTQALNQGLVTFVRDASPDVIPDLVEVVSLVLDSEAETEGAISVYNWPVDAFGVRKDAGIVRIILDGSEFTLSATEMSDLSTLRYFASNSFYGSDHPAFLADTSARRIYALEDVTAKARIVKRPEEINDDNEYGTEDPAVTTAPVDEAYFQLLSDVCLRELLSMGMLGAPETQEIVEETQPEPQE